MLKISLKTSEGTMITRKNVAMLLAELLGTATLTLAVFGASKSAVGIPYFVAIAVGLALALIVSMFGNSSGAHVNPAVTLAFWTLKKIDTLTAALYIAMQFAGAAVALRLYEYLTDKPLVAIAEKEFSWPVLVAELVGTMLFTMGIAAAVSGKFQDGRKALAIGGSLGLGILIAGVASNAVLNPAVALGIQSWSKAYVAGPIIGGVIGMNLYAYLFSADKFPGDTLSVLKPKSKVEKVKETVKKVTKKAKRK